MRNSGVIHRNGNSKIGEEMSFMLQAMKHRGPDSTDFALYCERDDKDSEQYVMRMRLRKVTKLSMAMTFRPKWRRE